MSAFNYPVPPNPSAVVETVSGTSLALPYPTFEKTDDPHVIRWVEGENSLTQECLRGLPGEAWLRRRTQALIDVDSTTSFIPRGGRYFSVERIAPADRASVYVRKSPKKEARVLYDPAKATPPGYVLHISPSPEGVLIAIATSEHANDTSDLRIIQVATGKEIDRIPEILNPSQYEMRVAWIPGGEGFYYVRRPDPVPEGEGIHQRVYFHQVGTPPSEDKLIFTPSESDDTLNDNVRETLSLSKRGDWLVINVATKNQTSSDVYLRNTITGETRKIASGTETRAFTYGRAGTNNVFIVSAVESPFKKVIKIPYEDAMAGSNGSVIIPERPGIILNDCFPSAGFLVVEVIREIHSEIEIYNTEGSLLGNVPMPGIGSISPAANKSTIEVGEDEFFFYYTSFPTPGGVYRFALEFGREAVLVREKALHGFSFNPSEAKVELVYATSKDGTRVPMFLVTRADTRRDGKNHAILESYGAWGHINTPSFNRFAAIMLETGGIYAVACVRGGGEGGQEWWYQGRREHKQHSFDDMAACAEWLIQQGYTSPEQLGMWGGSAGGQLVIMTALQHPELFKAIIAKAPFLDLIRYVINPHERPFIGEVGNPEDPAEHNYVVQASPLHNVTPGVRLPAMMLVVGREDNRVKPWHAYKFLARVQEVSPGGPFLLRSTDGGHSGSQSANDQVAERVDQYRWFLRQVGVNVDPIDR